MAKPKKTVKTYVKTDFTVWERFKKFVKRKGMTLEYGHQIALEKMMEEEKEE